MPYPIGDAAIMSLDPNDELKSSKYYYDQFLNALLLTNKKTKDDEIERILTIPLNEKKNDLAMKLRKQVGRFFPEFSGESKDAIERKNHRKDLMELIRANKPNQSAIDKHIGSFLEKNVAGRYSACLFGLRDAMKVALELACSEKFGVEMSPR